MKPSDELMHEHEIILHMLSGAEHLAQSILSTDDVEIAKVKDIIDFSRNFTDGCHHRKEEKHFFLKLQERGMSGEQGPIAVMLYEHSAGRNLIQGLDSALKDYEAGKPEAKLTINQILLEYVELLRAHIAKENNILFPMGDRILTEEDQETLEASFKKVEEQDVAAGVHEKYHKLAHKIGG